MYFFKILNKAISISKFLTVSASTAHQVYYLYFQPDFKHFIKYAFLLAGNKIHSNKGYRERWKNYFPINGCKLPLSKRLFRLSCRAYQVVGNKGS